MPAPQLMVDFYTKIPALLEKQSELVQAKNPPLAMPAILPLNADDDAYLEAMKTVDRYVLPSKALFIHMRYIENLARAYHALEHNSERKNDAQKRLLETAISTSLLWFKRTFVGRLYSEIDAFEIEHTDGDLVPSIQEGLTQWFKQLEHLLGENYKPPHEANCYNDAQINMCRVSAAHERLAEVRQRSWFTRNALDALNAFWVKVSTFTKTNITGVQKNETASSLGELESNELRALYQRFQFFITDEPTAFPKELDSELCYLFNRLNDDNARSYRIQTSLGPLAYFTSPIETHPLAVLIKNQLADERAQSMLELSELTNRHTHVLRKVFALAKKQSHLSFSQASIEGFRRSLEVPSALTDTKASMKALLSNQTTVTLKLCYLTFAKEITTELLTLFSVYTHENSTAITDEDRNAILNYLHLLSSLFLNEEENSANQVIQKNFSELHLFLQGGAEQSSLLGDDAMTELMNLRTQFDSLCVESEMLLDNTNALLTQAYHGEFANEAIPLIEGHCSTAFKKVQSQDVFLSESQTIKKAIEYTLDNTSCLITQPLSEQKSHYMDKLLTSKSARLSKGCSEEVYGYLLAEKALTLMNEGAKQLDLFKRTLDKTKSQIFFKQTAEALTQSAQLLSLLKTGENYPKLLCEQLSTYYFILHSQLPCRFSYEASYPFTYNPRLTSPLMSQLPPHWPAMLEEELQAAYARFEHSKKAILTPGVPVNELPAFWKKNRDKLIETINDEASGTSLPQSVNLLACIDEGKPLNNECAKQLLSLTQHSKFLFYKQFWEREIPELLAKASHFEASNNLKAGVVTILINADIDAFHLSQLEKGVIGITNSQHYELEKLPHYSLKAKASYQALYVDPFVKALEVKEKNAADLSQFLTLLKESNTYWFRSHSLFSSWAGWGLSFLRNRDDAGYLKNIRAVRKHYLALRSLLINTKTAELTVEFIADDASLSKNLSTLLGLVQQANDTLHSELPSLKEKKAYLDSISQQYEESYQRYLQVQEGEPQDKGKIILPSLVETRADVLKEEIKPLITKEQAFKKILDVMAIKMVNSHFTITLDEETKEVKYRQQSHLLPNSKIQFGKELYVKTATAHIDSEKNLLVETIIKTPELLNKSADELKTYIYDNLKPEYERQVANSAYYIQVNEIKKLVEVFDAYFDKPQWCTENKVTITPKRGVLTRLSKLLMEFKDCDLDAETGLPVREVEDRFNIIKTSVLGSDEGESFKSILMQDINPSIANYNEVFAFISHWVMKLFRVLHSFVTQRPYANKRDELANKIVDNFLTLNPTSSEDGNKAAVETQTDSDGFVSVAYHNVRSFFWSPPVVSDNDLEEEDTLEDQADKTAGTSFN